MGKVENFGFIKFPRDIYQEPWAHRPSCVALFVYLLTHANLEAKDWDGIRIDRGQLVTSRSALVSGTGCSEKTIRRDLDLLEQYGAAKKRAYTGAKPFRPSGADGRAKSFTLITICNYDSYSGRLVEAGQAKPASEMQPRANHRANHTATTKEDIRNISADAPDFLLEQLILWRDYRHEKGEELTPSQLAAALEKIRKFSGDDPEKAAAVVREAISAGWRDLFLPKKAFAALEAKTPAPAAPAPRRPLNLEDLEKY